MFARLFSSIIDSTIWREPSHVRIVWITLLAKSDRSGIVWCSIQSLSELSRVPLHECVDAINRLKSPNSWSPENEGIIIEEIEGGWRILNYEKYRKIRNADERTEYIRIKVAQHRRNKNKIV